MQIMETRKARHEVQRSTRSTKRLTSVSNPYIMQSILTIYLNLKGTEMKHDFSHKLQKLIAELNNKTCIDAEVLEEILQDALNDLYDAGFDEGYDVGYGIGYDAGYDAGYAV